ncbi:Hypothetical predicted protein [Scomber scombrus]|uniref:Uncharacterized protein n=1 Tax=Scomber scombrus TaxID=13677 RepID=A0AAV1NQN2_SCOSC
MKDKYRNRKPLMQKRSSRWFQFISWTSVNKMSTVSSPPTFRHLSLEQGERPKGQQSTTVVQSIDLLNKL